MVANPQHQPAIEFMQFATIGKHLIFALAKTLSPPFCTNVGSALSFWTKATPRCIRSAVLIGKGLNSLYSKTTNYYIGIHARLPEA